MKIEEYKTASGYTLPGLDKNVNQLIKDGFQPFGNPYYAAGQSDKHADTSFCQAMVKEYQPIAG
ncbi:MAG: hypothetical protein ABSD57_09695 [Verrucomicrobiota bacterium]|jgi:hypothetical protein